MSFNRLSIMQNAVFGPRFVFAHKLKNCVIQMEYVIT